MNDPKEPGKPARLGDLETGVMRIVWEKQQATVQDVLEALLPQRALAYTTVMTVMSRLAKKGFLVRRKEGRAYVYAPASPQETQAGSILQALVDRLYAGGAAEAIAHLLETDDPVSEAELDRLEAMIRAKREAGKK